MILEHAIYGSATGLGSYRVLSASNRFLEQWRTPVEYHASLGWSALDAPFKPIFSYYSLAPNLWAFTRTFDLGQTSRGNDYLVHAIVLDPDALARIDYRPFTLAGAFVRQIPSQRVLPPLKLEDVSCPEPLRLPPAVIASSIRALARGPLRLRIDGDAVQYVRELHESLPPSDRMRTTFCTRFSYGRELDFRLSAFVPADEDRLRALTSGVGIIPWPPAGAAAPDLFDRWTAELRADPDLDMVGPSILTDVVGAFALLDGVRKLRLWTVAKGEPVSDIAALAKASATVLRPENRNRPNVQPLLPGALAVDLGNRVRVAKTFEESAERSAEMLPEVRRQAIRWIGQLPATPTEAWIVELLLRLPDDPLETIAGLLERTDLNALNATAYRAYLSTIMSGVRDRFGETAAAKLASITTKLPADALMQFVRVLEEVAPAAPAAGRASWLLAIVRAKTIAPGVAGRIVLANGLVESLTNEEIERFASAFFGMEELLAQALRTIPEGSLLHRALASELEKRLRTGWKPRTAAAPEIVRRVFVGASAGEFSRSTAADLTIAMFHLMRRTDRAQFTAQLPAVIERLTRADLTPAQASLLVRSVLRMERVAISPGTRRSLVKTARRRNPPSALNAFRSHVRHRALSRNLKP